MILVYIDESGDIGYSKGSSPFYILSAIAVPDTYWDQFHAEVPMFIGKIISSYNKDPKNIKELHFKEFKNGQRKWFKTYLKDYFNDLKSFLENHCAPNDNDKERVGLFTVAVIKRAVKLKTSNPLPIIAIQFLIERLSWFAKVRNQRMLIIVDNSNTGLHSVWRSSIQDLKNQGTQYINAKRFIDYILEEAVFVDSKTSPEIQLVDSVAGFVLEYLKKKSYNATLFPFYKGQGWGLKLWP